MRLILLSVVLLMSAGGNGQAAAPQSPFISYLIESAEAKIKKSPTIAEGYSDLAFAFSRRARETEDPLYWKRAEQAIVTALKLDPTYFDARKARVIVRMQQGRYADAQEEAAALNKRTPDDNLMYGLLTDAALAQGRYSEAEAFTQRMLDLRQVNAPGLERAAAVREIIGFPDGALEFWTSALRLTSTSDVEERAYILTQLAALSRRQGKLEDAGRYAGEALSLEPDYPAGLVEQARISLDGGKPEEALTQLEKRLQQNEDVGARYFHVEALQAAGRTAEADQQGNRFLAAARAVSGKPGNCDNLLMRYLTARGNAKDAVQIGRETIGKSANVEVLDAYATALLAAGDPKLAAEQMDRVIALGIRNPVYFLHAAEIHRKNHDSEGASAYLKKCLEVNGNSRYAALALKELQVNANAGAK